MTLGAIPPSEKGSARRIATESRIKIGESQRESLENLA